MSITGDIFTVHNIYIYIYELDIWGSMRLMVGIPSFHPNLSTRPVTCQAAETLALPPSSHRFTVWGTYQMTCWRTDHCGSKLLEQTSWYMMISYKSLPQPSQTCWSPLQSIHWSKNLWHPVSGTWADSGVTPPSRFLSGHYLVSLKVIVVPWTCCYHFLLWQVGKARRQRHLPTRDTLSVDLQELYATSRNATGLGGGAVKFSYCNLNAVVQSQPQQW